MAERDVVRITFKEIESIAETLKEGEQEEDSKGEEGSSKRRKKTKRPEQAIYRPGQLRISKKEKEGPSAQEGGCVASPEEEEDWEVEQEKGRGAYGTTDEESSRGSKENSVDKDGGGGGGSGRDTARCTPSPSTSSSHRKKGEGGDGRAPSDRTCASTCPKPGSTGPREGRGRKTCRRLP